MLIEAARRAEAAAKDMLACVNSGSASTPELHQMLAVSKTTVAIISAAQTAAAATIAKCERHGDGGAQVLADTAGLSRREARGQVKTAQTIESVPTVRDAVDSGRVSLSNARRLAEAVTNTSAADVDSDTELLAKAETMRPEDFTREARRWITARQADGGESDYRRQRAKRCVRVWDADDGTVELHGRFDPVTGRRIGNRLQAEARRLYNADKKNAKEASSRAAGSSVATGNGRGHAGSSGSGRRSFDQCMADALDELTSNDASGGGKPFADITVVAHIDNDTGQLVAEIAGGDPLPHAVFEEISCNARLKGAVYDTKGALLWQGYSKRVATEAQLSALIARYGGCFHCKAHPDMCQAHHIEPVSRGGPTNIDNMVLICWDCHQSVHHRGWQIHTLNGQHTLHPPDRTNYGPARAPEQPILHAPDTENSLDPPIRPGPRFQPPPPRYPAPRRPNIERTSSTPPERLSQCAPHPAHNGTSPLAPEPAATSTALASALANDNGPAPPQPAPRKPPNRQDQPLFTPG